MNIKKLREIAERATPGVRYAGPHYGIYLKKHTDYLPGGNGITYSDVLCTVRPYGVDDQAFIATFNPETVLRLLDRIECYEAALKFYADGRHITETDHEVIQVIPGSDKFIDHIVGLKAREALRAMKGE